MADFQQELDHELNQWYKAFENTAQALLKGGIDAAQKVIDYYKDKKEHDQDGFLDKLRQDFRDKGMSLDDLLGQIDKIADKIPFEKLEEMFNDFVDKFQNRDIDMSDFGSNGQDRDEEINWDPFNQERDERGGGPFHNPGHDGPSFDGPDFDAPEFDGPNFDR